MSNFENILRFSHFTIALDKSRIMHFLAEIMSPKNSASGNFLTFSMSEFFAARSIHKLLIHLYLALPFTTYTGSICYHLASLILPAVICEYTFFTGWLGS